VVGQGVLVGQQEGIAKKGGRAGGDGVVAETGLFRFLGAEGASKEHCGK
jgi:hypothetical protein